MRRQRHTKIRDPIFDFAQSKILTSNEYTIATEDMKLAKQMAERQKEQHSAKAAARDEVARLKELRAVEQAELQARRQAVREEAQRVKAQRLADAAAAKAAKAVERARKASERQDQQGLRTARAAEMAQGKQGTGRSVGSSPTEPQVPPTHISSSNVEDFHNFPTTGNIPYFFSPSPTFSPMSFSAHLSFQQLNSPMQSMQSSHPML
jgi:hypothetical protein